MNECDEVWRKGYEKGKDREREKNRFGSVLRIRENVVALVGCEQERCSLQDAISWLSQFITI